LCQPEEHFNLSNVSDVPLDRAKAAAVQQWTSDPCGPVVPGTPGEQAYFERLDAGRRDYAPWMAEVLPYQARDQRVLDVGCGQGIDLVRYAGGGAIATGIDLTPRHVELARQHLVSMGLEGTVVQGDAEHLPFPDASFDIVSSNGVLHHTPDMDAALREIRRVLRPGGRATVIVYHRDSINYWVHQFLARGLARGMLLREGSMSRVLSRGVERTTIDARPLVRVYTRSRVRQMLGDAGFSASDLVIRHFDPAATPETRFLVPFPRVSQWLAERFGWYVVATAIA